MIYINYRLLLLLENKKMLLNNVKNLGFAEDLHLSTIDHACKFILWNASSISRFIINNATSGHE